MWYLILAYVCISRSYVAGWIIRDNTECNIKLNSKEMIRLTLSLAIFEVMFAIYVVKKIMRKEM